MVKLKIDKREIEAEAGCSLIEVLRGDGSGGAFHVLSQRICPIFPHAWSAW